MLSVMKKSVLLVGAFLVLGGGTARAAVSDVVEVKVPFPFVVNRQAFPAGEYRLEWDMSSSVLLIRGEKANHTGGFVMTRPASGQDPAGTKPALTFTRHEDQYRLSGVWESSSEGWSVTGR